MICVTWLLLIDAIYSGGFVSSVGLECDRCIYLCVKFEYASFPIGPYVHSFFHMRNLCIVVEQGGARCSWLLYL